MKKLSIVVLLFASFIHQSKGQKADVTPGNQNIEGVSYSGYTASLKVKPRNLDMAFLQSLKAYGKTRKKNGYYFIDGPTFDGVAYVGLKVYGQLQPSDDHTSIWLGYDETSGDTETHEALKKSLKQAVQNLGNVLYQESVKNEVSESERALQFTNRKQQRLLREEREYKAKLVDAEEEKIRLEKLLEATVLEIETLNQKILDNKATQDTTQQDLQKLEKAVELTKAKLDGIE